MTSTMPSRAMMYNQIVSQPALLLEMFDHAKQRVDEVLSQFPEQRWQAVYTGGCGDSFYAGLEVGAIDFDDCGFGHHAYDLAVALNWFRGSGEHYEAVRTEFLLGYRSVRPLTQEVEDAIELFSIARVLVITLWVAGRTDNPYFGERLKKALPRTARLLRSWLARST